MTKSLYLIIKYLYQMGFQGYPTIFLFIKSSIFKWVFSKLT